MSSNIVNIKRKALDNFKELGSGGFSTVYKVRYELSLQNYSYAYPRGHPEYIFAAVKKLHAPDYKELELLSKLKHPYVVKLFGVVNEIPDFFLVLELCEGGSLRSYLNKHKKTPLHLNLAYTWIEQGALAIQYLHSEKVIHRDLKADNFLISRTRNIKLCDFGISKRGDRTITVSCLKGTFGWTAPECFEDQDHVSPLSDIFSFGICIWEILTREVPFEKCEYAHVMHRVCLQKERPRIPDSCSPKIVELLEKCWKGSDERKQRPSIDDVVTTVSEVRKQIQCKYHF
ncbi:mitogen-activated protein kinase kinase kinase 20-like [Amphiura filiformis]|uniref:mitogen-activated protein kinase kinase kinase 20-like n=1 Tax=Amphiura filiformis TaxID=82378 RepID=UPI003B225BE6